ncbi:MAG: 50S ribosomal protein L9 [Candidatus Eisenbacteria bacterium]|nr:50S ribosomal protein L9 [Candidatus Eisenbacteria bacterium]
MEIILLEDVGGLGSRGARVNVSPGYARNFLLPKRMAIAADGASGNIFQEAERQRSVRENKSKKAATDVAARLSAVSVTIAMEAGEEDRLFGSVTTADIAEQINAQGFDIDKRKILLDEPLKQLGVYNVSVKIHGDVEAQVKVWVVRK